ncbi:MAG TPA: tetratricopeptide repeat protein [Chitinophagaceae bacterium]|nr:tetratricopeptide repeat protein [Chitinophagaceae bacterium]
MAKKKKIEKHVHSKISKPKAAAMPNWHIPLILIITFIIYIPALSAGFVNWDDPDYVGENSYLIRDLSRLPELFTTPVQGNYHPLTMFSLALNFAISGDNEWSYHLFNLLFHLVNCYLVYRLAFLLSKNNSLIALVTSLLFAIHPLHVESVAWISERKDVLYALFFIAGHITYTKYIDTASKKQYWLTLLFVVLSLMSKPAAVIFPVSLFCIDILRRRQFSFKLIIEKIPFFIPAIIMGLLTINAQKTVGATGEEYFGLGKNILFGCYGIMMYFVKMIIPFKLAAFYPFPALNENLPPVYYAGPVFTLLLAAVTYFTWKKYRFAAFGIAFYIVNLSLVLQIFSVGSAVIAERYTYVPFIGLFFIAGCLLDRYAKGNMTKAYAFIIPVTLIFSVVSFLQTRTWKSGETLWDNVIKNQPCSRAYSARATLFRRDANKLKNEADADKNAKREQQANLKYAEANKNYQKAIDYYTEAVKLNAIDHESYNNRANIYMDQNKFSNAIVDYKQALVVKPNYYVALDNMGALYARRGMFDSALYYFTRVLEQKPDYKPTYSNRAITYMSLKRYNEAIKDWQRFLSYQPNDPDVTNTIGECYRMMGKNQEALGFINTAIQLDPQPAYFLNRSYTYKNLNNIENARNDALTAKKAGMQLNAAYASSLGIQ